MSTTGFKCLYCTKRYKYATAYQTHVEAKHRGLPSFRLPQNNRPATTRPSSPLPFNEEQLPEDAIIPLDDERPDSDVESDRESNEDNESETINVDTGMPVGNGDNTERTLQVTKPYPSAGRPSKDSERSPAVCQQYLNPWRPFRGGHDFRLAKWFVDTQTPKTRIDEYFHHGLSPPNGCSFTSGHTLRKVIDQMEESFGVSSWSTGEVQFDSGVVTYYHRDPIQVVDYLLRQRAFVNDIVYAPVKEYNAAGERVYSEMHTGDWWWETQDQLPEGATVVPIICTSDETHLTNFSGDKKIWPIYMTIGNLPANVRNKPSNLAIVLLGLLPVPPKVGNLPSSQDAKYKQLKAEALHQVLEVTLRPLRAAASEGVNLLCPDGQTRLCYPVLAAWLADHMEYIKLFNMKPLACPVCDIPETLLGSSKDQHHPTRSHAEYQRLWLRTTDTRAHPNQQSAADRFLTARGIRVTSNAFWDLPGVRPELLHVPDLLHGMYLGLLKHLMVWIEGLLKKHGRTRAFDEVWKSLPPYPGFTVPKKAYGEVSQWQGKEMRNLGRAVLGALAASLSSPTAAQRRPFTLALQCTRALVDFHLMAQYRSHTPATLGYMESYLADFHSTKDVFLEFRAGKRTQAESDQAVRRLRNEQLEDHGPASQLTPAKRRRLAAHDKEERGSMREDLLREGAHFNFIKMHLPTHYKSHVERLGAIPAYSTEVGENAHRSQMKDGYRSSNRQGYEKQILAYIARVSAMGMREKNLRQLAQEGYCGQDVADALGLECPIDQQSSFCRHRCLKGRLLRERVSTIQHIEDELSLPDLAGQILQYWRQVLKDPALAGRRVQAIRGYTAELYNQLEVPVQQFQADDGWTNHAIRCTGGRHFRKQAPREDWVWIRTGATDMYGALRGHLPGRIKALFKIRVPGLADPQRLAVARMTTAEFSGKPDDAHGLVSVLERPDEDTSRDWVINIRSVVAMAHLIQDSNRPRRWFVNNRIDLWTFNEFY